MTGRAAQPIRAALAAGALLGLAGCAVMQIDVDVYKGPLANHEDVQTQQFAAMARRPYLVNTARAGAVDHEALLDALRNGTVTAALLDVYPDEPVPRDSPLLAFDKHRLHLTPHSAGVSRDIPANTARILAHGLADLTKQSVPPHVANREAVSPCLQRLAKILERR